MTLLVRDEEDVLEDNLRYHLAQGVDQVIITDNCSSDSTPEILERLGRSGRVRVLREPRDDYSQAVWVTRMARMAYAEYAADWVINNDADEFWWPKEGNLKTTLEQIPPDYGVVRVPRSNFPPRPGDDGRPLARMQYREVRSLNPLGDPLPPKACHRGHPDIEVAQGNHALEGCGFACLPASEPIIIFHFPMRSYAQFENKIVKGGRALERNRQLPYGTSITWRELYKLFLAGELPAYYQKHLLDDSRLERGLASGELVRDLRLLHFLADRVDGPIRRQAAEEQGLRLALGVEGWMKEEELRALIRLAAEVPAGASIVEIGSYRGRSTIALAAGASSGGQNRVYSFDPHLDFDGVRGGAFGPGDQAALYRNLADAGVGEQVFSVSLDSRIVAPSWPARDVGLLLVDGDHRKESVRADVLAWLPHLREDAVMAFDDVDLDDVAEVITELQRDGALVQIGRVGQLAWFRAGPTPGATYPTGSAGGSSSAGAGSVGSM